MAILGFSDLRDFTYPALWDLAEIKKLQLSDGTTFDRVIADVNAGLRLANADLLSMPHYNTLFSVQDNVELEYPVGVKNGIEEATEYGTPNPSRGKMTGHSIGMKAYDRGLGWTLPYLRKARQSHIDADVQAMVIDIKDQFPKKLLERFFKSTADTVGATSGASVPFCDGGTADANYIPLPNREGATFLYTHDHYLRYDTHANGLAAAMPHLLEHDHTPPFDLIGSLTDLATWKAVTGWISPKWGDIDYMQNATARATVNDVTQYYGYIETNWGVVRVWLSSRVPTNYFGLYKAYGVGDARNPLRVRIDPKQGFGWQLAPGTWVNAPTMMAVGYTEYGVGIGTDRTNGLACFVHDDNDYVDPTIS